MGKPLVTLLLSRNAMREDTMEAKTCTEGKQVPAGVSRSPAGTDRGHCYEDLILRNVIQMRHRSAIETLNTRENTNKEDKNGNELN